MIELDKIDHKILLALQRDGTLSQRDIAELVGLSQNACWRRLRRLQDHQVLVGQRAIINPESIGMGLTVFVMIKTRNHSKDWSDRFRRHVAAIPQITEFHRIGGEWDYFLKIVTDGMRGYDGVYQTLITGFELDNVTGYFSMERIFADRPLALTSSSRTTA